MTHTRLEEVRAGIAKLSEHEVLAVLNGILNAEWCSYSDDLVDGLHDTACAFDREYAAYLAMAEYRRAARKEAA